MFTKKVQFTLYQFEIPVILNLQCHLSAGHFGGFPDPVTIVLGSVGKTFTFFSFVYGGHD